MRWKIETKSEVKTEKEVSNGFEKTKKIRTNKVIKRQYITIGDIVGMGKSASGAIIQLIKNLPKFINNFKNINPSAASVAQTVNMAAQPAGIIMAGMDKYKKIMGVIDTITPIVKTIARATGVWCSPGNVSDLGQIALGTLKQIGIAILTSGILRLKEMIWNFEFQIREIPETSDPMILTSLLKKFMDKMDALDEKEEDDESDNEEDKGTYIPSLDDNPEDFTTPPNQDKETKERLNALDKLINQIIPSEYENVGPDIGNVWDKIKEVPTSEEDKGKINYNLNNYITQKPVVDGYRMLFGSLEDKGIYYSDDNGDTWIPTKQITGSFNAFAKIKTKSGWRYLAGSTECLKTVKPTEDTSPDLCKDIDNHYNKDYYNKDTEKLTKREKNDILNNNSFEEAKKQLYDRDEYIQPIGILYSDDDGITWNPTEITEGRYELFFEFQEKVGHPARTVVSSYDYNGIYYTEDGFTWKRSKSIDGKDIVKDRWVFYTDSDNELSNTIKTTDITSTVKVEKPFINTIQNVNIKSSSFDIGISVKSYQGKDFENFDKELVDSIIDYIHYNYSYKLPDYTEVFWYDLINRINAGTYTLEDAIAGKDLGL